MIELKGVHVVQSPFRRPFDFRFTQVHMKLWGPKSPARSCAPSSTLGPSVTRWCQSVKSSRHFDGRQQPHLFCTKSSSRTKTSFYAKMFNFHNMRISSSVGVTTLHKLIFFSCAFFPFFSLLHIIFFLFCKSGV